MVLVLMTCFNRKEKTSSCIKSLADNNKGIDLIFVVVDDNSNDGTFEMLNELSKTYNLHIVMGTGELYYSGGMRLGMNYIMEHPYIQYDYLLMVNDDVVFYDGSIDLLLQQSKGKNNAIIIGATCDETKNLSYGAIKYTNGIHYRTVPIMESDILCDTFNANCVLIPRNCFINTEIMDSHYKHSLGDFDYGLTLKRNGNKLYSSNFYVGYCNNNTVKNTWGNANISIIERIRLKESIKGAPFKPWFYFLKKNFGVFNALVYSFTPYIRIFLKR